MTSFFTDDFMLGNKYSKTLYNSYAKNMPIIDYHCHIDPMVIAQDQTFSNITEVWLYGDHYKWRAMRAHGVEEQYITGNASDYEKFLKWAETLEYLIGNPLYHWTHLELATYFDYKGVLNSKTANEVWNICNKKLKTMSAKQIIEASNVELICTTDDPLSDLKYHKQIAKDNFKTKVLPTWRPDRIISLDASYIKQLEDLCDIAIISFDSLKKAITKRMDYFHDCGCILSDHSFSNIPCADFTEQEINEILVSALQKKDISSSDLLKYQTALMLFLSDEYSKRNWAMQLHYGVTRNTNTAMFEKIGADTGFDAIGNNTSVVDLGKLLNLLTINNCLPKTIIYSLNPNDNTAIDTMIGCFQGNGVCRIQHGAAWWFNDNKTGIIEHLTSLANQSTLGHFIGMLTDSRSLLSYTRHDYFRRILCQFIGKMVEDGEYPQDYDSLEKIVKGICYFNAKDFLDIH